MAYLKLLGPVGGVHGELDAAHHGRVAEISAISGSGLDVTSSARARKEVRSVVCVWGGSPSPSAEEAEGELGASDHGREDAAVRWHPAHHPGSKHDGSPGGRRHCVA